MNHVLRKLSFLLLTGATVAQQQATTLWHLAEHASAVVVAAATSATDPNPEWHRIEFRTDEVLKGAVGPNFRLLEPAGRCCGHALFSVIPGQSYLLFLDRRGQTLHPLAGDRGVLAADPILVAHVRRLMTASSDVEATGRELAAALQMVDSRMAQDAALALSCLPTLPADGNAREGIRSALRREASAPTTALPALAAAVVRMDPAAAASNLLPLYLTTTQDDAARTLQFALDGIAQFGDLAADAFLVKGIPQSNFGERPHGNMQTLDACQEFNVRIDFCSEVAALTPAEAEKLP